MRPAVFLTNNPVIARGACHMRAFPCVPRFHPLLRASVSPPCSHRRVLTMLPTAPLETQRVIYRVGLRACDQYADERPAGTVHFLFGECFYSGGQNTFFPSIRESLRYTRVYSGGCCVSGATFGLQRNAKSCPARRVLVPGRSKGAPP